MKEYKDLTQQEKLKTDSLEKQFKFLTEREIKNIITFLNYKWVILKNEREGLTK